MAIATAAKQVIVDEGDGPERRRQCRAGVHADAANCEVRRQEVQDLARRSTLLFPRLAATHRSRAFDAEIVPSTTTTAVVDKATKEVSYREVHSYDPS